MRILYVQCCFFMLICCQTNCPLGQIKLEPFGVARIPSLIVWRAFCQHKNVCLDIISTWTPFYFLIYSNLSLEGVTSLGGNTVVTAEKAMEEVELLFTLEDQGQQIQHLWAKGVCCMTEISRCWFTLLKKSQWRWCINEHYPQVWLTH